MSQGELGTVFYVVANVAKDMVCYSHFDDLYNDNTDWDAGLMCDCKDYFDLLPDPSIMNTCGFDGEMTLEEAYNTCPRNTFFCEIRSSLQQSPPSTE